MKKGAWAWIAAVGLLWGPRSFAQSSSVDAFYDALSPYGQWFQLPPYGWVWQPSPAEVGADFVPYQTGGYWTYTDAGWSFETDWPWEWAVFHYGRWAEDATYGWVWAPDTVWAPSWVDWRMGGDLVGWAPLAPLEVAVEPVWIYVEVPFFCGFWVEPHVLPRSRRPAAFLATKPVHDEKRNGSARWFVGPARGEVERLSSRPVPVSPVRIPPAPGQVHPGEMVRPTLRPTGAPPPRLSAGASRPVPPPAARPSPPKVH